MCRTRYLILYIMGLLERFLQYVAIDTQSDENSESFPSTKKQYDLLNLLAEQMKQLGEAASKAGMSMQEAINAFAEKIPAIISAFVEVLPTLVDITANAAQTAIEAMMKEVATPKEWHLMNHAKKARTRKKYRNRLLRRLREQEGETHGTRNS